MDYMICYDYRTLDFDTSILEQYRQVNVVAWSMGVWAAPIALASVPKEKLLLIAFNGTITLSVTQMEFPKRPSETP